MYTIGHIAQVGPLSFETCERAEANPKAVTSDELYGTMSKTKEWKDGLIAVIFRNMSKEGRPRYHDRIMGGARRATCSVLCCSLLARLFSQRGRFAWHDYGWRT